MRQRLVGLGLGLMLCAVIGGCPAETPGPIGDCPGCVADGVCQTGDTPEACGQGASACVSCAEGELCADGECAPPPKCTSATCPMGCCQNDECQPGTLKTACGQGGAGCEICGSEGECVDNACSVPPCGPGTCPNGCCTADGRCDVGIDDLHCGGGGAACSVCGASSNCIAQSCQASQCKASCTGCCNGVLDSDCVAPQPLDPVGPARPCGLNGGTCQTCAVTHGCDAGVCVVRPNTTWSLRVKSGEVPLLTDLYDYWDAFQGAPDPYVTVSVGAQSAQTVTAPDTTKPSWSQAVLIGLKPDDLIQNGIKITMYDDDLTIDDTIGSASYALTGSGDSAFYGIDVKLLLGKTDRWVIFELVPE